MALKRNDLLHPDLSYSVIGACFDVFNELGFGHRENIYQKALEIALRKLTIPFEREKRIELTYRGSPTGLYILDFVIDNKIVVELKVAPKMGYTHIHQARAYLVGLKIDLALLVYFTKDGVKYRRILRPLS